MTADETRTHARTRRGTRGFGVVRIVAIIAAVLTLFALTIPPFMQMTRRARTVEAVDRLAEIYRGSVAYYTGTRATQSLAPVIPPRQFPVSVGITPATVPAGARAIDPSGTWRQPTWQALNFAIEAPESHYFSYQYESDGSGPTATFTARALGDLDGNGVRSTFERGGRANAQLEIESTGGLWVREPVE